MASPKLSNSKFAAFIEHLADAANYDNVATYIAIKRWARLHYGDNPPTCVVSTLKLLREKFAPAELARLTAVPKTSPRALAKVDGEKE